MRRREPIPRSFSLACFGVALLLAPRAGGAAPDVVRAVEDHLAGARTHDLYLMIDKPLYRPGETVHLRAWDVARASFEPTPAAHAIAVELRDPRGGAIVEKRLDGSRATELPLPPDAAGGRWLLRVTSASGASAEQAFVVSSYELPRIKKELAFGRDGYLAGDEVVVAAKLARATGEPLADAPLVAVVWLDGAELTRVGARTSRKGTATIRFQLPARIGRGEALVTLLVDDGGATESIQRRIPLRTGEVRVDLYPEGGDLVVGLPSRVYFAARSPSGEPVDLRGSVVDDRGVEVAAIRTEHRGAGRFALTPAAGRSYRVKLDGFADTTPLPAARAGGCAMSTRDDFLAAKTALVVDVRCTESRGVVATAVVRERLVDHAAAEIAPGAPTALRLTIPRGTQGVARITLFDDDRRPIAERLVYRGLGDDLAIALTADRDRYSPRDGVTLRVKTTTRDGAAVPADLAIAVVDDTVLSYADDRTGRILARLYLEPEMPGQTIEDPNFYFSGDPAAPAALDLLLGTQGWRRFKWNWVE